jgi:hypothetical protein
MLSVVFEVGVKHVAKSRIDDIEQPADVVVEESHKLREKAVA